MKAVTKIVFTDDNGTKFFGEGPLRLLRSVERTGSLRSAAMEMEMAYSKAWNIIRNSEEALGFKLLHSSVGGKGGGGAYLTEEAVKLLGSYDTFCSSLRAYGDSLFDDQFGWLEK